MKKPIHGLLYVFLGACLAMGSLGNIFAGPASFERLIGVSISVDDLVVLRSSTSDDGYPDADKVWGYLDGMALRPTSAFAELGIDPKTSEFTLRSLKELTDENRRTETRNSYRPIELHIRYGGRVEVRDVNLVRMPSDEKGERWMVEPDTVRRFYDMRLISRYEARRLKDPGRKRPAR